MISFDEKKLFDIEILYVEDVLIELKKNGLMIKSKTFYICIKFFYLKKTIEIKMLKKHYA